MPACFRLIQLTEINVAHNVAFDLFIGNVHLMNFTQSAFANLRAILERLAQKVVVDCTLLGTIGCWGHIYWFITCCHCRYARFLVISVQIIAFRRKENEYNYINKKKNISWFIHPSSVQRMQINYSSGNKVWIGILSDWLKRYFNRSRIILCLAVKESYSLYIYIHIFCVDVS